MYGRADIASFKIAYGFLLPLILVNACSSNSDSVDTTMADASQTSSNVVTVNLPELLRLSRINSPQVEFKVDGLSKQLTDSVDGAMQIDLDLKIGNTFSLSASWSAKSKRGDLFKVAESTKALTASTQSSTVVFDEYNYDFDSDADSVNNITELRNDTSPDDANNGAIATESADEIVFEWFGRGDSDMVLFEPNGNVVSAFDTPSTAWAHSGDDTGGGIVSSSDSNSERIKVVDRSRLISGKHTVRIFHTASDVERRPGFLVSCCNDLAENNGRASTITHDISDTADLTEFQTFDVNFHVKPATEQ